MAENSRRYKSNSLLIMDVTELLSYTMHKQQSFHQAHKLAESLIGSKKATFGEEHLSTQTITGTLYRTSLFIIKINF
jgi:hypothetical protein